MQRISRPQLIMVGNKKWMWIIVNAILLQISAHPSVIKSINHTHYGNDKRKLALPSLAAPAFKRSLIFIDLLASGEYLFGWINTLKNNNIVLSRDVGPTGREPQGGSFIEVLFAYFNTCPVFI